MVPPKFIFVKSFIVMDTVGNVGKLTEVYMIAGSEQVSKDLKKNSHYGKMIEEKPEEEEDPLMS
jgi:hypothetical protein